MDLHIHSCLSPCGDDAMVPERVVLRAMEEGLQVVGICDHNTAGNVPAFQEAGRRIGVGVLGGMEIASREEIHVLALFDDLFSLRLLEERIGKRLQGENSPEAFGDQILVNAEGLATGLEERLLIGAVDLSLGEIVETIRSFGGLAVASHVDRPVFSVLGQLGFVPEDLELDAVELSPHHDTLRPVKARGLPAVTFSDAHFPEEIGRTFTRFRVEEASVRELRLALHGRRGRGFQAVWKDGGSAPPVGRWKTSPCT